MSRGLLVVSHGVEVSITPALASMSMPRSTLNPTPMPTPRGSRRVPSHTVAGIGTGTTTGSLRVCLPRSGGKPAGVRCLASRSALRSCDTQASSWTFMKAAAHREIVHDAVSQARRSPSPPSPVLPLPTSRLPLYGSRAQLPLRVARLNTPMSFLRWPQDPRTLLLIFGPTPAEEPTGCLPGRPQLLSPD